MLYESITYEDILSRMIRWVEDWAREQRISIDTREGSLIKTALSPAAVELKLMYMELDEILNETFADTATREFLIKRCEERGILVEKAKKASRQGEFNIDIEIGSRFSLNQLNYKVTERISEGVFKLECETPGSVGNHDSGRLIPIDYISGLTYANLSTTLVNGEDEEDTEHLRQRYFDSINSQAFGGNIADYKEKVNKLQDVGGCKVEPVYKGGGTVRVVLINSKFQKPSQELVNKVQKELDPVINPADKCGSGLGLGLAPIGHIVTVEAVNEMTIEIKTQITFQSGMSWNTAKPYVEKTIQQYLDELAKGWDKVNWEKNQYATLIVRISQLEARIIDVDGVLDVQDTTLNGIAQNFTLDRYSIPIWGSITNVG